MHSEAQELKSPKIVENQPKSINDKKIEIFFSKKVIGCFIFRRFALILFLIDHPLYFDR